MKNETTLHRQLLGIVSILALMGFLVFSYFSKSNSQTATPTSQEIQTITPTITTDNRFTQILSDTSQQIITQNNVDQNLLNELHTNAYGVENPLVVVNPYNTSPLTALVLFTSPEPLNISIHVDGLDSLSDVDFTFDGFSKEHIIPVYGLYPDKVNQVILQTKSRDGKTNQVELKIETEPLPDEINETIFLTDIPYQELYQPGINFSYKSGIKTAFDLHGTYRWFLTTNTYLQSAIINPKHILLSQGETLKGDVLLTEINPLGRIIKVFYAPYGVHHDLATYHDNILVTGSRGETTEDFIYEMDTSSGKIINSLDLITVLQRSRRTSLTQGIADWFHLNAITWTGNDDDEIVISGRDQSAIVKLSWPEGKISWILASPDGWLPMFDKYLLTPVGESFEWPYGQHAPEILPDQDNNPDTMDILLFDNGNNRFDLDEELQRKIRNNEIPVPELFSRMVQYRINEKEMTVEQIWQFGKEYGDDLFSVRVGDANLLPNGNRLGVFDVEKDMLPETPKNGTFFEVTEDSEIVWSAQMVSRKAIDAQTEYRLTRMEIYNQSANDLQIGTPVINLIPQEILEQYGIQQ
jgi:arylsulfate sulfotransferase